ncbi:MAG: ADP-ribosylation factor-like protein [Candidatus Hodarchaeota archaeon]
MEEKEISPIAYLTEKEQFRHKILFTGLDTAGKTSIISVLHREFSNIAKIEPTRGLRRQHFILLGHEISEWDLGGQKSYRISYLKNPSKFFDRTEVAIYVIDIQNKDRLDESLSYLNDVLEQFRGLKINPPLNIFFHKCDPMWIKSYTSEVMNLINELSKKIEDLGNDQKIHFYQTSIFNLYSIMSAMSEILLELFPKAQLIQKTIEEFAKKLNCEGIIVIDDNSIIIGSFFENEEARFLLNKTMSYFLQLNDNFLKIGLNQLDDKFLIQKLGKYFVFRDINIPGHSNPYHVLLLSEYNPLNIFFNKKVYISFIQILVDIIKN